MNLTDRRAAANATTCKPTDYLLRKPGAPTSPLFSFRAARRLLSQNAQIYESSAIAAVLT